MKQTASEIRDKHMLICYSIHNVTIPEKYSIYIKDAMEEYATNQVQSYKEELRGEIGGLIKFNDCSMPSSEDERIHKAEIAAYNQAISQVKSLLDKPQEE